MHCDLDLWPFDPEANRAHPWLKGSVPVKFHEDQCKGEAVMPIKPFYLTPYIVTLTFNLFTRIRCKGEALMHMKPFYLTNALWPWPLTFWPQGQQGQSLTRGGVPMKFHENRCKGEAVMRIKPFYLTPCIVTLTFDLLTLKSTGPILDSWGVCLWSFMRIAVKGKQLCAWNHFT